MKMGILDAQEKSISAILSPNLDLSVSGEVGIKVALSLDVVNRYQKRSMTI